jgi:hypothetical protein
MHLRTTKMYFSVDFMFQPKNGLIKLQLITTRLKPSLK